MTKKNKPEARYWIHWPKLNSILLLEGITILKVELFKENQIDFCLVIAANFKESWKKVETKVDKWYEAQ